MAVTFIFEVPGAGAEQYDAVMERLGPDSPPGRIYHVAGPVEDGWMVVDVWETAEDFERFLAEDLLPAARATGFFASLPLTFPVHRIVPGAQRA
ncbi:MAG: hypothetical protein ACRDZ3_04680 [Acidimicrobiia bacterium]